MLEVAVVNRTQVFNNQADDGIHGNELWKYNRVNVPSMVPEIYLGSDSSSPSYLTVFNNELYFSADDGIYGDVEV